jgi:hypothetical protein
MQTVLPYLRRIEQPNEDMFEAMRAETPFVSRRKIDKSGYEVVRADNADWREVISGEERTVVFEGSKEDAEEFRDRCEFYWRFNEMLQIAAKHPIPNPEPQPT